MYGSEEEGDTMSEETERELKTFYREDDRERKRESVYVCVREKSYAPFGRLMLEKHTWWVLFTTHHLPRNCSHYFHFIPII